MKTTKKKSLLTIALALGMSLAVLSGCSQNDAASTSTASAPAESSAQVASGGTLVLKVNPEIALAYDDAGLVTGLTARNGDAEAILEKSGDLIGQPARDAVRQLVTLIGEAGYFVEKVEGERRQITIEIEPGSALPSDAFLDEVVADVKSTVAEHSWQARSILKTRATTASPIMWTPTTVLKTMVSPIMARIPTTVRTTTASPIMVQTPTMARITMA